MTKQRDPYSSTDVLEPLYRELDALQKRVAALENKSIPTMPKYDSENFPQDSVEGQLAIVSPDRLWAFIDGEWHPIGSLSDIGCRGHGQATNTARNFVGGIGLTFVDYDTDSMISGARININTAGKYVVTYDVNWPVGGGLYATNSIFMASYIVLNSTDSYAISNGMNSNNWSFNQTGSAIIACEVGDDLYTEVGYKDGGPSLMSPFGYMTAQLITPA